MTREHILEMYELYKNELMSCEEVGKKFGIDRRMVHYYFKREKLRTRRANWVKEDCQHFNGKTFSARVDKKTFRMTSGRRELMHHYVWRSTYGFAEIPKGYCIVHKDGDWRNNEPWNLECVPRSASSKYARHNNRYTAGRGRVKVNKFCEECGARIQGSPKYVSERIFCGRECFAKFRKGTKKNSSVEEIKREKALKAVLGANTIENVI